MYPTISPAASAPADIPYDATPLWVFHAEWADDEDDVSACNRIVAIVVGVVMSMVEAAVPDGAADGAAKPNSSILAAPKLSRSRTRKRTTTHAA